MIRSSYYVIILEDLFSLHDHATTVLCTALRMRNYSLSKTELWEWLPVWTVILLVSPLNSEVCLEIAQGAAISGLRPEALRYCSTVFGKLTKNRFSDGRQMSLFVKLLSISVRIFFGIDIVLSKYLRIQAWFKKRFVGKLGFLLAKLNRQNNLNKKFTRAVPLLYVKDKWWICQDDSNFLVFATSYSISNELLFLSQTEVHWIWRVDDKTFTRQLI